MKSFKDNLNNKNHSVAPSRTSFIAVVIPPYFRLLPHFTESLTPSTLPAFGPTHTCSLYPQPLFSLPGEWGVRGVVGVLLLPANLPSKAVPLPLRHRQGQAGMSGGKLVLGWVPPRVSLASKPRE